jgi:hypothetical protein
MEMEIEGHLTAMLDMARIALEYEQIWFAIQQMFLYKVLYCIVFITRSSTSIQGKSHWM